MLQPIRQKTLFAAGLAVLACSLGVRPAQAVCIQPMGPSSPSTVCPIGSCVGPCACPVSGPWGYNARQWQPWPGSQYRQDIVFPQSIGVERVAAPRGEKPKPLPRETYVKRKRKIDMEAEQRPNIPILQGVPLEPTPTPVPFDYMPELGRGSPQPDYPPQGPLSK